MKNITFIFRMLANRVPFEELIQFLYGETPPPDNNYLAYNYTPYVDYSLRFNNKKTTPLFSIIIPTYNRCRLLSQTINAIGRQKNVSSEEFELVLMDNASKDATREVVTEFARRRDSPSVAYIKLKENYGGDLARNIGVLHSRGRLLVFADDDCITPNDWLSEFRRELDADPKLAGVGGFKMPKPTEKRLVIYHKFTMWGHFLKPHVRTKDNHLLNRCGQLNANVCYHKNVFEKIGGFNIYFKHIASREFKIRLHKSGATLLYEPKMVNHFADFSLSIHIKKCLIQGLDWYFLYLLHPDIRQNPTFLFFLKRTINDIKVIFTNEKHTPLFPKSASDKIQFSFVSIVTNFCLWFGKYWLVAVG